MEHEFPKLLNPTDNQPYILVAEQKDLLNSKLLTARNVSDKVPEASKHDRLVVIEDFLKDLTQKSPLAYTPDQESQALIKAYNQKKTAHDKLVDQSIASYKQLGQKLQHGYTDTVNNIQSQLVNELGNTGVQNAYDSLQAVLKSDPEQEASIPKPAEIVSKITELRAAPELPEYVFTTTKRVRAWRDAPSELCNWNKTKEEFYRKNLESQLSNTINDKSEVALKFWNQQIQKLGSQVLNILQQDDTLQQQQFVDLNIETAEAFALLLNTMITPETRIILHVGDFSAAESKSIAESFQTLTAIKNLQISWNVQNKATGLANIAQAISQATQLQVLQFKFNSTVQVQAAKDFFTEFKEAKLTNLVEVSINAEQSTINSAIQYVSKALKQVGGAQVQRLLLNFSQAQVDNKSAQQIGDALSVYKGVKKLVLNFSGYSLNSNNIKDDGFIGLVENVTNFADTLAELNINVSRNTLTDKSLASLNKHFQSVKWSSLKNVTLGLHYNKITETGARKLGKFLHSLPILVNLSLNLNSTEINQQGLSFLVTQLGPQVTTDIQVKHAVVTKDQASDLVGRVAQLNI